MGIMDLLIPEAQAYGTAEHRYMVDTACRLFLGAAIDVKVREDVGAFTLGELTSLAGDYYATPPILRANAARAREFLNDHVGELDAFKPIGEFSSAVATHGTYLELATSNYSHFRLGSPQENAPGLCTNYHMQARAFGLKRSEQGLVTEGFALHFLTDLFAAGHMRTPRYALTHHLANNLGEKSYRATNAAIMGGLLAKAQHDRDNKDGLMCSYRSVSSFLTGQPSALERGTFHGDGSFQSTKSESVRNIDGVNVPEALLHLYRVIAFDIVTAAPSFASMLSATSLGKELLPYLMLWNALEAGELTGTTMTGKLHKDFVDAVTPRPLDPPVNKESLFFVQNRVIHAAKPVDEVVAAGLHLRCPSGRLTEAWLELWHVDLNIAWITVNPYVDVGIDAGVRYRPFSVKPYVSIKIDAGVDVTPTTKNLLDTAIRIDGDSEKVIWIFDNVIFAAKAIRITEDAAISTKDAIVDGLKSAGEAVVDGLGSAAKAVGDILVPPAY